MNKLISGENANHKKKAIEWTEECQIAFDQLKEKCTQTPILPYANYKKPFIVHTDVSELGLGAVLYQIDDAGVKRVIVYASRTLSQSERKYPVHKLEFLAVKWAVIDQFHEYLYGGTFHAYTDNKPLTYVLTSAKLDATGQCWVASLANYTFQLFYKMGKTNAEVDALSRIRHEDYTQIIPEVEKAITTAVQMDDLSNFIPKKEQVISRAALAMPAHTMTQKQWQEEQKNYGVISELLKALENKLKSSEFKNGDIRCLLRHKNKLVVKKQLLYHKYVSPITGTEMLQFVLPTAFHEKALQACHDNAGHLRIERTMHLLKDIFYWPEIQADIKQYVKQCPRCLRFKMLPERTKLNPIVATHPWELIYIDFLTVKAPRNSKSVKDVNILIVTDHFTRYAQAFVTSSQQALCSSQGVMG